MIFLIIGDNKKYRSKCIKDITDKLSESEVLICEDTDTGMVELERYLYPSLFDVAPPIVHLRFIAGDDSENITDNLLKKLIASPTIFIFEEFSLNKKEVALFKKSGAIIHLDEDNKKTKKDSDDFAIVKALIAPDKKSRWLMYREAIADRPIEAVMGILYWKVRELANSASGNRKKYLLLYKKLLNAQAMAWQSGVPLDLAIEKVILEER